MCCNDIAADEGTFYTKAQALARGYRSCAAFPLVADGRCFGIIVVYGDYPGYFGQEEIQLLTALAENLSFAVEAHWREDKRLAIEAALRRSEASMAAAQSVGKVGSWEKDLVTGAITWSAETYRIFEADPATFTPARPTFQAAVHPDDRPAVDEAFTRSLTKPVPDTASSIEHRVLMNDGRMKVVEERWQVICDDQGEPVKAIGTCRDVTGQRQAEQTLRESEARFRSYFELPLHGIAVTSPEKGMLQVNDRICSILGYAREELMAMSWVDFTYPADLDADVRQFNRLLAGEIDQYELEKRFVRKDGQVIWTTVAVGGSRNPDGTVAYLVGVMSDITERKRAEQERTESEQRFRQLAENIDAAFWITDPSMTQVLYISPAYERIWGCSCESLYADPASWLDLVHPEDSERIRLAIANKKDSGEYEEFYRIVRADGLVRWIHDRAYPVRNEQGEVYRMVGTASDITENKQVEEVLFEQATLLDKAQDAIVVRDLNHRIRYWNRGAARLYGWTEAEALDRSIRQLLYRNPEEFDSATDRLLAKGEWTGEIHQVTKDGRPLMVECRWTLVRDDQGQPKSVLAINTDITERKKLEQQFLRAQRMESIGTLAGGIAQDLNNVLAPIMMAIDLLRLEENNPRRADILSTIGGSARRGADMVRQLLSFAQGVTGQQLEVKLDSLISEIEKIVNETFLKNVHVRTEVQLELWTVQGDPTQLHQVLLNLCVNARDAMPGGGMLTLTASNLVLDEQYAAMNIEARPGAHVVIQVEDTGTGMPPEVLDRIFEPFYTTKAPGKGTGLGLSTTAAIVKSHGGFMRVYSETGIGTKFRVYLPAHSTPGLLPLTSEPGELPRGHGELVLLVDDEEAVRQITRQTLEAFGYRVLVACDGVEATALYASRGAEIAVVLTDMMMPVMDGPKTIQVLMRINPEVRIIAASGLNANGMVAKAANAGVMHFLPKPYTAEALLQTLQTVLKEKKEG